MTNTVSTVPDFDEKHRLRNKKTAWLSYLDKIAAWLWQDNGGEARWTLIIDDVLRHASLKHPPTRQLVCAHNMASPAPATVTSSPRLHRIPCNAPLRPEQRTAQMQPARAQRTARASITAHIANNPHPVQRRAPATSPPRIATTHRAPTAHDARASQHFALVSSSLFCEPRRNFMSPFLRTHCSLPKFLITPQIANAPQAPHGLLPKTSQTTYFSV